jgi:hypothetical protein
MCHLNIANRWWNHSKFPRILFLTIQADLGSCDMNNNKVFPTIEATNFMHQYNNQ